MSWKALWPVMVFAVSQHVFAQTPSPTLVRKSERAELFRAVSTEEMFIPVWSGYALLGVRSNKSQRPTIWASSSAGTEDIEFSIPGAARVFIYGVAASRDHTIAIGGFALSGESQGSGFIAIIPPDRNKKLIVRTAPFTTRAITIAPDGVIWTVGVNEQDGKYLFNILKRFDQSGVLVSSVNMTVKPIPQGLGSDVSPNSHLQSSADRVGWLTGAAQYLEFSFDGREIGRFEAPPWHEKPVGPVLPALIYLALSETNDVVVAGESPIGSVWRLNRSARQWTPVSVAEAQVSQSGRLLGFDGDELIIDYRTSNRGEMVGRFSVLAGN